MTSHLTNRPNHQRHAARSTSARLGRGRRSLVWLAALTAAAIFGQALLAGQFVNQEGRESWIEAHGVVADVSWVLALVTAIVAWRVLRSQARHIVVGAAALFAIALAQTGIGHLITDKEMDWLIAVHVPLAIATFGLALWLAHAAWREAHPRRVPESAEAAREPVGAHR